MAERQVNILLVYAPDVQSLSRRDYDRLRRCSSSHSKQSRLTRRVDNSRQLESTSYKRVSGSKTGMGSSKLKNATHSRLASTCKKHRERILVRLNLGNILCNGRLVNPIKINLLFITARNAPVWERLLLHDCMIKHRFVSRDKP